MFQVRRLRFAPKRVFIEHSTAPKNPKFKIAPPPASPMSVLKKAKLPLPAPTTAKMLTAAGMKLPKASLPPKQPLVLPSAKPSPVQKSVLIASPKKKKFAPKAKAPVGIARTLGSALLKALRPATKQAKATPPPPAPAKAGKKKQQQPQPPVKPSKPAKAAPPPNPTRKMGSKKGKKVDQSAVPAKLVVMPSALAIELPTAVACVPTNVLAVTAPAVGAETISAPLPSSFQAPAVTEAPIEAPVTVLETDTALAVEAVPAETVVNDVPTPALAVAESPEDAGDAVSSEAPPVAVADVTMPFDICAPVAAAEAMPTAAAEAAEEVFLASQDEAAPAHAAAATGTSMEMVDTSVYDFPLSDVIEDPTATISCGTPQEVPEVTASPEPTPDPAEESATPVAAPMVPLASQEEQAPVAALDMMVPATVEPEPEAVGSVSPVCARAEESLSFMDQLIASMDQRNSATSNFPPLRPVVDMTAAATSGATPVGLGPALILTKGYTSSPFSAVPSLRGVSTHASDIAEAAATVSEPTAAVPAPALPQDGLNSSVGSNVDSRFIY